MTFKRALRSALALLLALSCLLVAGCSTPKIAMEVGGKVYEMGDYLAYAFGTAQSDSNAYVYLYYYGKEALSMDFVYGEGDDQQDVSMKEYLVLTTRDMMVRQKALEDMLAENGLKWDAELEKDANEALKVLKADQYLPLGFNNDRYIKMYKAFNLNEASLFDGLYNKGGKREVKEEDIRKFFDENYLSYYMFEISLVDDEKKPLSDDIIEDYQKHFGEYLAAFNKSKKTAEDFQEIYRQFKADTAEEKDEDKDDSTTTTTTGTTTGTTAAGATTTTASGTTTTTTGEDKKEEEKKEETQRVDIVKTADGVDEELVKAVEKIAEGEAKVVTYKQGGTANTLALIYRMDPEADRGQDADKKDIDYYEQSRDQTLQHMKYDEFDAEVKKRMEQLMKDAVINDKALHAVDFVELLGLKK